MATSKRHYTSLRKSKNSYGSFSKKHHPQEDVDTIRSMINMAKEWWTTL